MPPAGGNQPAAQPGAEKKDKPDDKDATKQPVVISSKLRNMPDKGLYSFDPTCYFGVYGMDTFWFDKEGS